MASLANIWKGPVGGFPINNGMGRLLFSLLKSLELFRHQVDFRGCLVYCVCMDMFFATTRSFCSHHSNVLQLDVGFVLFIWLSKAALEVDYTLCQSANRSENCVLRGWLICSHSVVLRVNFFGSFWPSSASDIFPIGSSATSTLHFTSYYCVLLKGIFTLEKTCGI